MYAENGLTPFQVGQFHLNATVETAGTEQRLVQTLGPVGSCQNHHALAAVKAVHLRQQLVQGLFALVVAAHSRIAALADGVYLVNKDNAGRFLTGLPEEVAHLGGTHADKHLHELRPRNGKERHFGLAGHGTGNQRLAGSRRAHQQGTLGQRRTDFKVFAGIVQEVHDFGQGLLGLVLPGHIGKGSLHVRIGINSGPALAERHEVAASAAHTRLNGFAGLPPNQVKDKSRQHPHQYKIEQR